MSCFSFVNHFIQKHFYGIKFAMFHQVCATYSDGFRATAVCPVGGPRAVEKARRTADSIIKRLCIKNMICNSLF